MRPIFFLIIILVSACSNTAQNIALGTLERDRIAHTATVNEVIVALPVLPGTTVIKGTVLVKLDDTLQKAQVAKAQAEVVQAEANFDKLQSGARKEEIADARAKVAGARAKLVESKANYTRAKDLAKRDLASKATLDQALATRDSSIASLKSTNERLLVLTNGTREEDLRIAEANIEVTKAILASELKKLADLTITATRDGILDNLPWNLGERVTKGSPVAIILAGKAPFARVYVPEPYRAKVKIGDSLVIHIDGIKRSLTGKLRWIATEPAFTPYYALNQEERSRLMYLAEVQLPDSESNLPNGIPAQVELP
ncbi:MAG: HlyD family secretion protein [Gammaproteobacteria bacterium]